MKQEEGLLWGHALLADVVWRELKPKWEEHGHLQSGLIQAEQQLDPIGKGEIITHMAAIRFRYPPAGDQEQFRFAMRLCGAYRAVGNYPLARSDLHECVDVSVEVFGKEHPDTAITYGNMGGLFAAIGDTERAKDFFEQALRVFTIKLGEGHPYTKMTQDAINDIER